MEFAKGFSQKEGRKKHRNPNCIPPQDLEGSSNCFPSTRLAVCSSPFLLLLCPYCLERHTQGVGRHAAAEIAERKTDEKRGAKKDKTRGKRQKKEGKKRKKTNRGKATQRAHNSTVFPPGT